MATITLSIPDKDIKKAIKAAAESCGYELADNFKAQDIIDEMNEDVLTYITNDLQEFFEEGIAADCYSDSLVEDEE